MGGCDITGNHDMTWCPILGGDFVMDNNLNLTGITHTTSSNTFVRYSVDSCNMKGVHDMSMLTGLGGIFSMSDNPELLGVTHTASTEVFTGYNLGECNLLGTHNIDMLTGLGGLVQIYDNPNLTDVRFPTTTETFEDSGGAGQTNAAFRLHDCDFSSGLNFYPLAGANVADASIYIENNGMSSTIVNTMLSNFSGITSNNINRWSGMTLDISGTNSAPDTTSGGINGIAALSYLTGTPAQWSITTS